MVFSLPQQVTIIESHETNREVHLFDTSTATTTDKIVVSSSTTPEIVSFRSLLTQSISKLFLILVPSASSSSSRSVQIGSVNDMNNSSGEISTGSPSDILSIYFSFAYYLCVSPFKFRQTAVPGEFKLHRFVPQQIICLAISITSLLIRLAEFRESWPNPPHESWNPVSYFRVCNALSNLIFHAIVLITFWIHSGRLLDIMNFYQKNRGDYILRRSWTSKVPTLIVVACTLNMVTGFTCFLFGTDTLPHSTWNPGKLYYCIYSRARYTLFLIKETTCEEDSNPLVKHETTDMIIMTPLDHTLTVISSMALLFRRINGLYEELFILAGAFTFWLSSNIFSQHLRNCNSNNLGTEETTMISSWTSVYQKYAKLTELSDVMNNAYGPVYFAFTITSLFYYSINLDNLLISEDILVRVKFIVFYTGLVLSYLLSADICRQIGYLEIWISKHLDEKSMSELSHKQLSLILHELATTRVGMTGCHLFTVTYSMVAQLAGILITYFIISVQYRDRSM